MDYFLWEMHIFKAKNTLNTFFELNRSSFINFIYYVTELAGLAK